MLVGQSDIAEGIFLIAVAAVTFGLCRVVVPYLNRILVDVKLSERGVALVFGRLLALRVIPYEQISSVRQMSAAEVKVELERENASIWGVLTRRKQLVVIRRNDPSGFFVCSPHDETQFVAEVKQRVLRSHEELRVRAGQHEVRKKPSQ